MRKTIQLILCIFLTLNFATISSFTLASDLQLTEVGAIDIMQEKQQTDIWRILGQGCGETAITITNSKGATMMPSYFSQFGEVDWSFSTASWSADKYTIAVNSDDPNCTMVLTFEIR